MSPPYKRLGLNNSLQHFDLIQTLFHPHAYIHTHTYILTNREKTPISMQRYHRIRRPAPHHQMRAITMTSKSCAIPCVPSVDGVCVCMRCLGWVRTQLARSFASLHIENVHTTMCVCVCVPAQKGCASETQEQPVFYVCASVCVYVCVYSRYKENTVFVERGCDVRR